jgi:predicted RNA binding protein YcfA (HicA-like mRNA interferase family)
VVSGRRVVRVLVQAGLSVVGRKGSHIRLKRTTDRVYIVVVPDHRELARGTLLSIIRQAGYAREEFIELLRK